jgi:hypothetical protein
MTTRPFPDQRFNTTSERTSNSFTDTEMGDIVQDLEDGKIYMVTEATSGETSVACLSVASRYGYHWIPMGMNWIENDGTVLAAFADGASVVPGFAVDNSEGVGIRWNNHANPDPIITQVGPIRDLDPNEDIEVHIYCHKSGATVGDAVTFDVLAYFNTVGALHDADANAGETSSAMDGDATAKTVQKVTATIDAADLPAAGTLFTLCLSIQPTDGTLGTDDVTVTGVELTYTKRHIDSVA